MPARRILLVAAIHLCSMSLADEPSAPVTAANARSPLDFTMPDIDGRPVNLQQYRGKVVLIVNVASRCGMTPQYEQLQALNDRFREAGLRVLAFPANNFNQEPGDESQIKEFCKTTYGVNFDMFSKVSVKGDDACELFKYLTSTEKVGPHGGEIRWNFTKFLVGRDGRVVARFEPRTRPDAAEVVQAIEAELKKSTR